MFHYDCFYFLSEAIGLKVTTAAMVAGRHGVARQVRGPE